MQIVNAITTNRHRFLRRSNDRVARSQARIGDISSMIRESTTFSRENNLAANDREQCSFFRVRNEIELLIVISRALIEESA